MPGMRSIWDTVYRRGAEEQSKGSQISPQELGGYEQQLGMSIDPSKIYNQSPAGQIAGGLIDESGNTDYGQSMYDPNVRGLGGGSSRGVETAGTAGSGRPTESDTISALNTRLARQQASINEALSNVQPTYAEAYEPVKGGLRERAEAVPGRREEDVGLIERGLGSRIKGLRKGAERARLTLGEQEEEAQRQTKETLRGIAQRGIQGMQAANQYLGSRGAGDSSLGGKQGRIGQFLQRGVLREQGRANEQLRQEMNNIDAKRVDLQLATDQEIAQAREVANDKKREALRYYQQMEDQIDEKLQNATSQERIQGAQTKEQLQQEMRSTLNQYDQMFINKTSEIEKWNRDRKAELDDAATRIAQAGSYSGLGEFKTTQADRLAQAKLAMDRENISREDASTLYGIPMEFMPYPTLDEEPDLIRRIQEIKNAGFQPSQELLDQAQALGGVQQQQQAAEPGLLQRIFGGDEMQQARSELNI